MATSRTRSTPTRKRKPGAATTKPRRERTAAAPIGDRGPLAEAFLANERMHQVLLGSVDASLWRAEPPGSPRRNVATSFAHIHNVRCMRLRMIGAAAPPRLDRARATIAQAGRALAASAIATARAIDIAMANGGRVPRSPLHAAHFLAAAIAHEAHHRGQISHWLRLLGRPLGHEQQLQLWAWDRHVAEIRRG